MHNVLYCNSQYISKIFIKIDLLIIASLRNVSQFVNTRQGSGDLNKDDTKILWIIRCNLFHQSNV